MIKCYQLTFSQVKLLLVIQPGLILLEQSEQLNVEQLLLSFHPHVTFILIKSSGIWVFS